MDDLTSKGERGSGRAQGTKKIGSRGQVGRPQGSSSFLMPGVWGGTKAGGPAVAGQYPPFICTFHAETLPNFVD